jgi:superfamily I DNA/RNA helicase
LQKIGSDGDDSETLIAKIDAWREEKEQKTQQPASLRDQAECLKIFATFGKTLAQAVAYAEHLFKQQGTIKLSTGHKAKGLEAGRAILIRPDLTPAPWVDQEDAESMQQELNLKYVMITRAKREFIYADGEF